MWLGWFLSSGSGSSFALRSLGFLLLLRGKSLLLLSGRRLGWSSGGALDWGCRVVGSLVSVVNGLRLRSNGLLQHHGLLHDGLLVDDGLLHDGLLVDDWLLDDWLRHHH